MTSASGERRDRIVSWALLVSSLTTLGVLAFAAYDETFGADWYRHQSDYQQQLLARAQTERDRLAAERFEVHPKQLFLPDLGRVDRCVTCHVSIGDPAMVEAAQPLTAHPGRILERHPADGFGCVLCHGGQGRATTLAEAHGHVPTWLRPLLPEERLQESCARCHSQTPLEGAPRYSRAMRIFEERDCLSCHKLRGRGGDGSQDITYAGDLHDAQWHYQLFASPRSLIPPSGMPDMGLEPEEIESLVFLMTSLSGDPIPAHLLSQPRTEPRAVVNAAASGAFEDYVGSETCIGCHRGLHPEAVATWNTSAMANTFQRIEGEPGQEKCLACHATGYDRETGRFSERGVGCEACHGPGRAAVALVFSGRAEEHARALRISQDSTDRCLSCHHPHESLPGHVDFNRGLDDPTVHGR